MEYQKTGNKGSKDGKKDQRSSHFVLFLSLYHLFLGTLNIAALETVYYPQRRQRK